MFSGLLILSFKVGAVPELINHVFNGYIAKSYQINDLCSGLDLILGFDKSRLSAVLDFNQRLILKDFSMLSMTDKYLKLYQDILAKN